MGGKGIFLTLKTGYFSGHEMWPFQNQKAKKRGGGEKIQERVGHGQKNTEMFGELL